jgi:CRP-like cAMP-binding protein
MGLAAIADHLRETALFTGMTDRAIEAIAAVAREAVFEDGVALIREGDPGDAFYVIVDGRVAVTRAGDEIAELGPGSFLGEIALIDDRPRTAGAVAAGHVKAIVIDRPAFLEMIERVGSARLGILETLTDRIRRDAKTPDPAKAAS